MPRSPWNGRCIASSPTANTSRRTSAAPPRRRRWPKRWHEPFVCRGELEGGARPGEDGAARMSERTPRSRTTIEIREVRPEEYEEAGRVTADAYRPYARGEDWMEYLKELADVADRAQRTMVLVVVEDGRILGTTTLELDRRVSEGEGHVEGQRLPAHEAHIRMLGVLP